MPLFELLMISAGVALAAFCVASIIPAARALLVRKLFWALLSAGSLLLSLASAFATTRRHSGTGDMISRGWPKPYYFDWRSWESEERVTGHNLLYFAGDLLFYAALLLALVTLWKVAEAIVTRRTRSPGA
jgi:hypothetical protein